MIRLNHPREERGIAAVFFGLAITVLIAGLGLSIDVGNVAYQRNKAQNAADTAARQLAQSCARATITPAGQDAAICNALQANAQTIAAKSFDGGTVTATKGAGATAPVTVRVSKNIDTRLLSAIGISSKPVSATATASALGGHPKEGYPVLPLGVSYCTWKNNSALAGSTTEANAKMVLRTDTLQSVSNLLSPLTGGALSIVPVQDLLSSLTGVDATASCTHPDEGQLLTLNGAVWLTGDTVIASLTHGLFGWDGTKCQLKVGSDLNTLLGGLTGALVIPSGCAAKFGPGKQVDVGKTILLPVYVPKSNLQNAGLNLLSTCVSISILGSKYGKTCVEVPPKIGVKVVGYAPFKITGWKYPGTPTGYDTSASCSTKSTIFNLYSVINGILNLVERLLYLVGTLLSVLLGAQALNFSLACNGLQGYFTKSFTKDPNFQYGTGGADFGASYVKLTD